MAGGRRRAVPRRAVHRRRVPSPGRLGAFGASRLRHVPRRGRTSACGDVPPRSGSQRRAARGDARRGPRAGRAADVELAHDGLDLEPRPLALQPRRLGWPHVRTRRTLKHVPLFHGLNDKQLKTLANNFTERSFREGQELTAEGKGGAGFFVIESGEARVTVDGARSAHARARRLLRRDRADRRRPPDRDDHGDDRRQELRPHVVAVPAARRGERLDRLAVCSRRWPSARARARQRTRTS